MTIPYLTYEKLIALLKSNEWNVVSSTDWETHNRIMIGKDGHTFPLPIKETYFYPFVVKICQSLDIIPPDDHLKCYNQQKAFEEREQEAEKEEGEEE